MEASIAAQNALQYVLEAKKGESIIIFCDDSRAEVGEAFEKGAQNLNLDTKLILLETEPRVFREEITANLLRHLTEKRSQIYINLFRGNREETPFRIKIIHLETSDGKTRLGHCPGVTIDMLTRGALALSAEEHKKMQDYASSLMDRLKQSIKIEITNPSGTEISLSVKKRPFFTDTKIDWNLMKWMNLPTGEVMVAPVENSLEGMLVCDAAIGGIGPIKEPVKIKVKNGKVESVTCENKEILMKVQNSLHVDDLAKVVGEFAFGINPKARFVEEFLETEKMLGTVHVAFGDNTDMPGGKNDSINHMDFLIHKPSVNAITENGTRISVLVDGVFQEFPDKKSVENLKEKLPISEFYKVINYITIFKTDLWWEAIVVFETYGKRQMGIYLWQKRNDQWKRKNKFAFRSLSEWNKVKNAVDQLSSELSEEKLVD